MPGPSSNDCSHESFTDRLRTAADVLAFIAGTLATFAEVLLFRKHFGNRYFQGLRIGAAFLLVPLFSLFWPGHDPRGLIVVWVLYTVRCVVHRTSILRRQYREARGMIGPRVHSYYDGEPVLLRRFPRMGEVDIKRKLEPAVMLGLGIGVLTVSPPLGWLFIWCAAGMFVHTSLLYRHRVQQAQDLADSAIESEQLAERFRELRGDVVRIHRSLT